MKTKFKPILFSTPMVQAILDGSKTQTRRIIKPQPEEDWMDNAKKFALQDGSMFNQEGKQLFWIADPNSDKEVLPLVIPGDILWVRETFCEYDPEKVSDAEGEFVYKAHDYDSAVVQHYKKNKLISNWKPSIFMPKKACRIFLKCNKVRAEKLRNISEEDAISEGVIKHSDYGSTGYTLYTEPDISYTDIDAVWSFESLWESINGKAALESNPWVWAYDFERIEKPSNF